MQNSTVRLAVIGAGLIGARHARLVAAEADLVAIADPSPAARQIADELGVPLYPAIEDLLAAAVNDAIRRVEEMTKEKMSGLTADMGLPPGMKLPF